MELKLHQIHSSGIPRMLLIVPYGIETTILYHRTPLLPPFNRTLWN